MLIDCINVYYDDLLTCYYIISIFSFNIPMQRYYVRPYTKVKVRPSLTKTKYSTPKTLPGKNPF